MQPRANQTTPRFLFEGLPKMTLFSEAPELIRAGVCRDEEPNLRFEGILSKPHIIKGFDLSAESALYRGMRLHARVEALFIIEPLGKNQSL